MIKPWAIAIITLLFFDAGLHAQQAAPAPASRATQQTESDEYTRYELLAPETASFKITYEVTATTAGAKVYFNPIRKGSIATDEAVYDAMTGEPLHFEVVSGEEARKDPLMLDADLSGKYIKVELARPAPPEFQLGGIPPNCAFRVDTGDAPACDEPGPPPAATSVRSRRNPAAAGYRKASPSCGKTQNSKCATAAAPCAAPVARRQRQILPRISP